MIEQQARVLHVTQTTATVRIGAQNGCSMCAAGKGCGAGLFGSLLRRSPLDMDLDNAVGAKAGQVVRVGISEAHFIKAVSVLYGLPLLAGLTGAAVAHGAAKLTGLVGGWADLSALAGGALAAMGALKFCALNSKPDISSADFRLMEAVSGNSLCDSSQSDHQVFENEV